MVQSEMRNQIISMKKQIEKMSDYFRDDLINKSMTHLFGDSLLGVFDSLSFEKQVEFFNAFIVFYNKILEGAKIHNLEN
jgi:hypothetical protein